MCKEYKENILVNSVARIDQTEIFQIQFLYCFLEFRFPSSRTQTFQKPNQIDRNNQTSNPSSIGGQLRFLSVYEASWRVLHGTDSCAQNPFVFRVHNNLLIGRVQSKHQKTNQDLHLYQEVVGTNIPN